MKKLFWVLIASPMLIFGQTAWPSSSWPSAENLTGIMSTAGVTEASGLHWNPLTQRLYLVQDDGRLRVLQYSAGTDSFSALANKTIPGGPEGITQVDFSANEFYVVDENNYEIRKFSNSENFSNITETHHWDLLQPPSPIPDTGNTGPEGICFVPDAALAAVGFVSATSGNAYTSAKGMGGLIFIAHQNGGYLWVFDVNPNADNDFLYVGKYKTNRSESCDLAFDRSTSLLYILHNIDSNYLEVTDLGSSIESGERKMHDVSEYFIANPTMNVNVEGVAITPKCDEIGNASVWLCRDVSTSEGSLSTDVLRRFKPFASDGACALGNAAFTVDNRPELQYQGGVLTVTCAVPDATIVIYGLSGKKMAEKKADGLSARFDAGNWPAGIYLISVGGNARSTAKWRKP
jgi:hypothetical protein